MTAHTNLVNSIDTRSFWATVLSCMPAVEAACSAAGRKYKLVGSRHYGDSVELRDFVLTEFGRLGIIDRFDASRMSIRDNGKHSAMAVYLYNQAVAVCRHRAQDLARINTYQVMNDDTGKADTIAYISINNGKPSSGELNEIGQYGDSQSDWSTSCEWSNVYPEGTDAACSLDSILALLSEEEIEVATAISSTATRAEAYAKLNNTRGGSYGREEVKRILGEAASALSAHM